MSFRQALRTLPRLATATRPVVARATPSLLQSSARHAAVAPRLFNSSAIAYRQAADPKWTKGTPITYEELKPITQSPSDNVLIVDVREPSEVALGSIPSSVNLPLNGFEKSLAMDEGDFTRVHGFHKPEKTQQIIFYCKAGVRAQTAIDLAKRAGFKYLRNYEGSFADWEKKDAKSDD